MERVESKKGKEERKFIDILINHVFRVFELSFLCLFYWLLIAFICSFWVHKSIIYIVGIVLSSYVSFKMQWDDIYLERNENFSLIGQYNHDCLLCSLRLKLLINFSSFFSILLIINFVKFLVLFSTINFNKLKIIVFQINIISFLIQTHQLFIIITSSNFNFVMNL